MEIMEIPVLPHDTPGLTINAIISEELDRLNGEKSCCDWFQKLIVGESRYQFDANIDKCGTIASSCCLFGTGASAAIWACPQTIACATSSIACNCCNMPETVVGYSCISLVGCTGILESYVGGQIIAEYFNDEKTALFDGVRCLTKLCFNCCVDESQAENIWLRNHFIKSSNLVNEPRNIAHFLQNIPPEKRELIVSTMNNVQQYCLYEEFVKLRYETTVFKNAALFKFLIDPPLMNKDFKRSFNILMMFFCQEPTLRNILEDSIVKQNRANDHRLKIIINMLGETQHS